jgi:hypothetical protein
VVRKFIFPVACFACAAWVTGFGVGFTGMRHHDIGTALLFAFGGLCLLLPWFVIALSLFDRMRKNTETDNASKHDDGA